MEIHVTILDRLNQFVCILLYMFIMMIFNLGIQERVQLARVQNYQPRPIIKKRLKTGTISLIKPLCI